MKRFALVVVLAGCGPSVAIVGDDGTTTDESTTSVTGANPTSATTANTSASTTVTTTRSDEVTSIDPTSGDDESSEVSDAEGFIITPDGGSCFTHCSRCDVWAQDCADGDKCMPWANDGGDTWNATRCSPIDPQPADIGEPCVAEDSGVSGYDNCDVAAMCWGIDPLTLEGTCVGFCQGSEANPICADGDTCVIGFDGTLALCLPSCDPLAPVCGLDEVCTQMTSHAPTQRPFVCLPMPPFVAQPYGSACNELQICDAALFCVEPTHVPACADTACCTTLGDFAAPPVCPDVTQTCIPFEPDATEGLCFCGVA